LMGCSIRAKSGVNFFLMYSGTSVSCRENLPVGRLWP